VEQRTGEIGCWILATRPYETLQTAPLYWHLYTFSDVAAANAARRGEETVTTALQKVWLMNVAPRDWVPGRGDRVAVIGPLPMVPGQKYAAEFMEAISPPGFDSPVHRHPGPEAWYTLSGEVCLETPQGKSIGRAGDADGVVVPGDLPMRLSVTGTELRRSLVLILHDASKPHTALTDEWTPKGLCRTQ
jgi:quercetin dioxygenase-like cupin family protein